jgi:hypothetical protein
MQSHGRAVPPTRRELRGFALTVGGAFLLLAGLLAWRERQGAAVVLAIVGGSLVAAGSLVPARLGKVHRVWMALALAISKVTTPLFMAIVYFGLLTPTALVLRLFGRRPLRQRAEPGTFWRERPPGARRSDMRRQF